MPEIVPAAPAQADVPTAVDQAVIAKDQSAYRAARLAERSGKPLAPAPAEPQADAKAEPAQEPVTEPAVAPDKQVSKRQQQINDYERRIAEQNERIARLEAQIKPPPAPAQEPKPPTQAPPAHPVDLSQPPLAETEFFAKYPDAPYSDFARYIARYDRAVERQEEQHQSDARSHQERINRLNEAGRSAHADFDAKLTDLVAAGIIFPKDIALEILEDPNAVEIAYALASDHDIARRLVTMPTRKALTELGAFKASLKTPASPEPAKEPPPKTVSDAPDPPTTLGNRGAAPLDPVEAAVRSQDQAAYSAARLQQRAAAMAGR